MNPTWAKGYARKGAALHGQRRYVEAIETYELGLKIEDSPAIRKGLDEVKAAKGVLDFYHLRLSPWIATHSLITAQRQTNVATEQRPWASETCSKIRACLQSSLLTPERRNTSLTLALCKKCAQCILNILLAILTLQIYQLQLIQQNPQLAQSLLSSDPRMIDVLGALMGIDMQGFSRPEGSDEVPPGVPTSAASPPSSPPPSTKPTPAASSSKVHEPEDVKMTGAEETEEDSEDAAAKKAAEAEKKLGADAYKKRNFEAAITHFSKAWETWPKDVTFLTNLAGECTGL